MSDNRPLDENKETCDYNSFVAYINAIYCLGHKYYFYYFKPTAAIATSSDVHICKDPQNEETFRHASWSKVLSAYLLFTSFSTQYDYIVCIDSDCAFKNIHKRVESIIEMFPDHDIITASNLPYHNHLPCCAFFICKNTDWTRRFLKTWYTYNPTPDEWNHVLEVARKTYNIPNIKCGQYWEQDTLWVLLQSPEIASHIQILDEQIMYSPQQPQNTYLIHMSHEWNDVRKQFFMNYTSHLETQTKQSFETILSIIPVVTYDASNFNFV